MFSSRTNHQGALIGLVSSTLVILYIAAANIACASDDTKESEWGSDACSLLCAPPCTPHCHLVPAVCKDGPLTAGRIQTFWYGVIGCSTACIFGLVGSLFFPPPPTSSLQGLTFRTKGLPLSLSMSEKFRARRTEDADTETHKLLN